MWLHHTLFFFHISSDQYSGQAAHWPTVPSQGQCREFNVCQHRTFLWSNQRRVEQPNNFFMAIFWTFLNQPWSWQHMHKMTVEKKSIDTHTMGFCFWWHAFLYFFFFTGRQRCFMLGRRGREPSGRCSCSAGGAVMQPSLQPPSSCRRSGSWAANDLAWPQLFEPTILPPHNSKLPLPNDSPGQTFNMQGRWEVTEKHGKTCV